MRHPGFEGWIWTALCLIAGVLFGCLPAYVLADHYGPRPPFIWSVVLTVALAAVSAYLGKSRNSRLECAVIATIGVLLIPLTCYLVIPVAEEKMLLRVAYAERVSEYCRAHFREMDDDGDGVVHQNELARFRSTRSNEADLELLTHVEKNIDALGHVVGVVAVRRSVIKSYGFTLDEVQTYPARMQERSRRWHE